MSAFGARREKSTPFDVLPPEPGTRNRRPVPASRPMEIVDADFVVLSDRPATVRTGVNNDNRRPVGVTAEPASKMGSLFVAGLVWIGRLSERLLQLLPARAFGAVVAGCFTTVFFFAGGLSALATVFAATKASDSVEIANVSSSLDDRDGMKVLSVYGTVANRTRDTQTMPAILVDVIAGGRTVARHRIETAGGRLAAGATDTFALKIPHGGTNMPKVAVSLASAGAPLR